MWIIFLKYIICIFVPVCVMISLPVYNMGGSVWRVIGWIKEIFSPFRKNALQQKQPNKKHCLLSHAFFSQRITRFLPAKSMTILYSNILYKWAHEEVHVELKLVTYPLGALPRIHSPVYRCLISSENTCHVKYSTC